MASVSDNFLVNLSQSLGVSYNLKKNVLGSTSSPNSALFNLLQLRSILIKGKPIFSVLEADDSFATIDYNSTLNVFQFSKGKVFYNANLISVPSQTCQAYSSFDEPGIKYFKFYLDYTDFSLAATVFTCNIESTSENVIIVDQLPSINYLNNFKQVNLNGYLVGIQSIDINTNEIILNQDVSSFAYSGSVVNLIFLPTIKYLVTSSTYGNPPDLDIPSTGIILASSKLNIDSLGNYSLIGSVDKLFVPYPEYSSPIDFFPNAASYQAFVTTVNNAIKIYTKVQSYDIESALVNGFVNYTTGITTIKTTFDNYWHNRPYTPTGIFQYGLGYQGLQKVDFDSRFKDFWYFYKNTDLTRTMAIFRGDIYGGNSYVGQVLGSFPGVVSSKNYVDYSDTSSLMNGTFSYGVSAVTPSGEYNPIFVSTSNFYFNKKVNNYISWTSSSISNLLFFHVYKNNKSLNGFTQSRLTDPYEISQQTLSDTILPTTSSAQGIGSSHFAVKIKDSLNSGIIGGVYFNAYIPDNTPLTGIQSCIISAQGENYVSPVVNISGVGTGAAISITTNPSGGISSVLVTSLGSGYTELPTLTVFDTNTNSSGRGAVLSPILSQIQCGIYTGSSTQPIGTSIAVLEPIDIASISSTRSSVNMNISGANWIGLNSGTNYWAVFSMNTPYSLAADQKLNFSKSTGFSTALATSTDGQIWSVGVSSFQVSKLGYLDKGTIGTKTSSNGVYLTGDRCATPVRMRLFVPNIDLSSISFSDVGTTVGVGTTANLPIQNSMTVYVVAHNSQTGIQSTLTNYIPRGTSRGTSILLGEDEDLFDEIVDVYIEPNIALGVNYIQNTTIINWTIYDFFTVDSAP